MCGIVGQIGPDACDQKTLLRMMGMLTHRGPDECGFLRGDGVAFGHLRLSIIDLKAGQQPMRSHDGRFWIVFNGEIFNHVELRKELKSKGHMFLTQSDTEVLINCYREWGTDCLDRLNGQWAFALWDVEKQSVFLARDRWGVRPLFYTQLADGQTLAFASEIKALLADERVSREWDLQTLQDIFVTWVPRPDRTLIRSISQIPPGAYMTLQNGRAEVRQWWRLDYSPDAVNWTRSELAWREELQSTLKEACRIRLRANVPVGA